MRLREPNFTPAWSRRAALALSVQRCIERFGKLIDERGQRVPVFGGRAVAFAKLAPAQSARATAPPALWPPPPRAEPRRGRQRDRPRARAIAASIRNSCGRYTRSPVPIATNCKHLVELPLSRIPVAGKHERLHRISHGLGPAARDHPEARVLFVRFPDPAMTVARFCHAGLRPTRNHRHASSALRDVSSVTRFFA